MTQTTKKVNYTINRNEQYNSIEIAFDGIPSKETRDALKGLKFRWHSVKKVWYGYADEETARNAIDRTSDGVKIPEEKEVDPGTLYAGWEGGNNKRWSDEAELKRLLKEDFRKVGIKATIRSNRAGYLTSLTFTVQISPEEIKSFEDWKKENGDKIFFGSFPWIGYTDENGNMKDIAKQEAYYKEGDEGERLRENIRRTVYGLEVKHLTEGGNSHKGTLDILTDAGNAKFEAVQAIVSSYNRDCTNSMIDYFDRDIYDWYTFKIA